MLAPVRQVPCLAPLRLMMASRLLAVIVVSVSVLWPASVDACSCAFNGLPCEAAWRAEAVFVGHVVSIEWTTSANVPLLGGRVELAVVEAFRGLQLSQVTLAIEGSNCDVPFRM